MVRFQYMHNFICDNRAAVESNSPLPWFYLTTQCDWLENSCHFLNQSEVKQKPSVTCSHAFSRPRPLHVFASSSDWFIALFASVVIGQSKLNWFWSYDSQLKTSLSCDKFPAVNVVSSHRPECMQRQIPVWSRHF